MKEKDIRKALVDILADALSSREWDTASAQKLTCDDLTHICRLAKRHDLAHLVSGFVYRHRVEVDEALTGLLQSAEYTAIYRHEQMKHAYLQICGAFEGAQIPYIPLKGSVIRGFYPDETMRTSCDIDILVQDADLERAIKALVDVGYTCGEKHYHDVSLYSPGKVHLELHFNIQEFTDSLDVILKDAWKYASPTEGYRYDFSKEFFVYYIYAHMAYHFVGGGCGLRTLMDIWVMEHRAGLPYTSAEQLLKKAGIYKFAEQMSRCANICFGGGEEDEFFDGVMSYICYGGTYGNMANKLAAYKSKDKGSFAYLMERIFLPYRGMTVLFPILKKHPYLLPFCWVARWVRALFKGKTRGLVHEMTCSNAVSEQKVAEIKKMFSDLGL